MRQRSVNRATLAIPRVPPRYASTVRAWLASTDRCKTLANYGYTNINKAWEPNGPLTTCLPKDHTWSTLWLDTHHITCYCSHLLHEGLDARHRCWVVPVHMSQMLGANMLDAKIMRTNLREQASFRGRPRWVLIPFHLEDASHFIMFSYDVQQDVLHTWDSFGHAHKAEARVVAAACKEATGSGSGSTRYEQMHVPRQRDGYQCGVWVCAFVLAALLQQDLPAEAFDDSDAWSERFRRYLYATMLTDRSLVVVP